MHHLKTGEGVARYWPSNSLGNEFNMCGKEGARVCVVVGHRAQAPLAEGLGSSVSLLAAEGAAAHLGRRAFAQTGSSGLAPAPAPPPRPSPPPPVFSHFPLPADSSWGQGAMLKQQDRTWAVFEALKTFALVMTNFQRGRPALTMRPASRVEVSTMVPYRTASLEASRKFSRNGKLLQKWPLWVLRSRCKVGLDLEPALVWPCEADIRAAPAWDSIVGLGGEPAFQRCACGGGTARHPNAGWGGGACVEGARGMPPLVFCFQ